MEMTNEIIIEIRNEVFGKKEWQFLEKRLRMLYEKALKMVPPNEERTVIAEIKELEIVQRRDTVKVLKFYNDITSGDIIGDYSKTAYLLAKKRKEKGSTSLLADYMKKVFFDMISSSDFSEVTNSSRFSRIISESLLDYNYASGRSDVISFRLKTVVTDKMI